MKRPFTTSICMLICIHTLIPVWIGGKLFSQTISIKDAISLEVIPNVGVFHNGSRYLSDDEGKVNLGKLAPGDTLTFQHISFHPLRKSGKELISSQLEVVIYPKQIDVEEVVISANKWEQRRDKIPHKVRSISKNDISLLQPPTAADVLGTSGEVFIQKSQLGGGSPMIRGFAANRVLLVVDGIRMNNAIFRSGNLQNVISLDALSIQHAEVVYGPGSVIYGSDALGGVMNFNTLETSFGTKDQPHFNVNSFLRYASANDGNTLHLDIQFGKEKWSTLTSITYSNFDDLRMGREGNDMFERAWYVQRINEVDSIVTNEQSHIQRLTGYNQFNILQKFAFKAGEKLKLTYDLHYAESSNIPRYDRLLEQRNGEARFASWYYGPQIWLMNHFQLHHFRKTDWYDQMKINVAYQQFQESRIDRGYREVWQREREEEVNALSLNIDLEKNITFKTSVFYGVEALYNYVQSGGTSHNIETNDEQKIASRYPDGSDWQSYAIYGQVSHDLSSRLTMLGGVRYSQVLLNASISDQFFPFPFDEIRLNNGAINGSFGLVYRPNNHLQVNINTATGFRAPNIDDTGKVFESEPGSVVVPNPELTPEYAYNADVGAIYHFKDRFKLEGTVFYTRLVEAMLRRPFQFDQRDSIIYDGTLSQVQSIVNAGEADIYGFQLSLEANIHPKVSINSTYTMMEGHSEDGESLRHITPDYGQTHLVIKHLDLAIDLYAEYQGMFSYDQLAPSERAKPHIYAKNAEGLPVSRSWYTLNAKLSYKVMPYFSVHVGIENIRDVAYRPYSSGLVAPGRNIILAIQGTL